MTDDAAERFEALYRQHFRAVLRYTLARVEPETAKDATATSRVRDTLTVVGVHGEVSSDSVTAQWKNRLPR